MSEKTDPSIAGNYVLEQEYKLSITFLHLSVSTAFITKPTTNSINRSAIGTNKLEFMTELITERGAIAISKMAFRAFHRLAPKIRCEEGGKSLNKSSSNGDIRNQRQRRPVSSI